GTFQCKFPDGPTNSTVRVQVQDSFSTPANSNIATVDVAVANVAPTATLSGDTIASEGQTKTYSYTVTDPGQDTPTATASCGLNGTKSNETALSGSLSSSGYSGSGHFDCTFPDGPANSTVSVTADDLDLSNNLGSDSKVVSVANVAPTVTLSG